MTNISLEFLVAYAEVYNKSYKPFMEVYEEVEKFFEEAHLADDVYEHFNDEEYMAEFLQKFKDMKENHLELEVYQLIDECYLDFFDACQEWDI